MMYNSNYVNSLSQSIQGGTEAVADSIRRNSGTFSSNNNTDTNTNITYNNTDIDIDNNFLPSNGNGNGNTGSRGIMRKLSNSRSEGKSIQVSSLMHTIAAVQFFSLYSSVGIM